MRLKEIFEDIIEQTPSEDDIVEFPKENIILFINRNERELTFSPYDQMRPVPKLRVLLNSLKEKFRDGVKQIKQQERDIFEVTFNPLENFEIVVDFVKNEIDRENE
jgi:hypothetical protein